MNYLLDTNGIHYLLRGVGHELPLKEDDSVYISFITKIELLSYPDLNVEQTRVINSIIDSYEMIMIDNFLINDTIHIRREHGLKLPDAVIAASAIQRNATLITGDKKILNFALRIKLNTLNQLENN
jgi:predicted nucleic acid-binding protein